MMTSNDHPRQHSKKPTNPFPQEQAEGSWAGITRESWHEQLDIFLGRHKGFNDEKRNKKGMPGGGKYDSVWRNTHEIKQGIKYSRGDDKERFRDFLDQVVNRTGYVDKAVCLGLGPFHASEIPKDEEALKHQLAVFLVLCDKLEAKHKNKMAKVFQDPALGPEEEYIICSRVGGKIVEHPGVLEYMDDTAFVFAPHLPWNAFTTTVLRTTPELYIGNTADNHLGGVGNELARIYIRHAYTTGQKDMTPEMHEIIRRTNEFSMAYERRPFDESLDNAYRNINVQRHFNNLTVHHKRREDPSAVRHPEASNSSSTDLDDVSRPVFGFSKTTSTDIAPSGISRLALGFSRTASIDTEPSSDQQPDARQHKQNHCNAPEAAVATDNVKTKEAAAAKADGDASKPKVEEGLMSSIHNPQNDPHNSSNRIQPSR